MPTPAAMFAEAAGPDGLNPYRLTMNGKRYYIAIDPDVERSGFALVDRQDRCLLACEALRFPNVLQRLESCRTQYGDELTLIIEDSDESVNWHYKLHDRPGIIAAKGRSVGLMHATGRHLAECAEAIGLEVLHIPPLRKLWSGPDGKITHRELSVFVPGLPARTNQEQRDAVLLAWSLAGLPIKLKP